jgi:sec-independent protein translocase protein TatA
LEVFRQLLRTIGQLLPTIGLPELLIILFIVLLLFGASKLPALARSLGEAVREFKKASRELEEEKPKPSGETSK